MSNRAYSEIYKEAMDDWVAKDALARLWEETKTLHFAQRCAMQGDVPVNRAEQAVKASREWMDKVVAGVNERTEANKAKSLVETVKIQISEHMNDEANHRAEARL